MRYALFSVVLFPLLMILTLISIDGTETGPPNAHPAVPA
jgi:hypothetical protein